MEGSFSIICCENINPEGFEVNQPLQKAPPSEQFVDPLRNTMQKKLSTLGNLYYQMFILSPTSD
ncbi:CLUMA_CG002029, isoform A [Clunio marinus]|uniref:CLUMA_CG002029, isoform A n=1 Tax=Clunio marinus TaxID=568069 RepID=A0A1J1HJL2_9DIPT|nr:CLUMA_CG002029, isoform A [Clunio marinus]